MSHPAPILVGQVAGVFGLMIAGLSYEQACAGVGLTRKRLLPYVPASWRDVRGHNPAPIRSLSVEAQRTYKKMRYRGGLPQAEAYAEAVR